MAIIGITGMTTNIVTSASNGLYVRDYENDTFVEARPTKRIEPVKKKPNIPGVPFKAMYGRSLLDQLEYDFNDWAGEIMRELAK